MGNCLAAGVWRKHQTSINLRMIQFLTDLLQSPVALRLRHRPWSWPEHLAWISAFGFGLLWSQCALLSWYYARMHSFIALSYVFVFILFASLPVFLAHTTSMVLATYTQSREYMLLCTTSITNGELARGLVLGALYSNAGLVALALGFAPLMAAFVKSEAPAELLYTGSLLGLHLDLVGVIIKHSLASLAVGLELLSVVLLLIACTSALFLWSHKRLIAAALALILVGALTFAATNMAAHLSNTIGVQGLFEGNLLRSVIVIPLTVLLLLTCLHAASVQVRRQADRANTF